MKYYYMHFTKFRFNGYQETLRKKKLKFYCLIHTVLTMSTSDGLSHSDQ
jgi:hypothetical protein